MKKKRESGTMKKLIKKIAIAILTGTIAFSVVPATVQAAGWKQNKNGYWWQENDYSYPLFVYPEGKGVGVADALIVKRK